MGFVRPRSHTNIQRDTSLPLTFCILHKQHLTHLALISLARPGICNACWIALGLGCLGARSVVVGALPPGDARCAVPAVSAVCVFIAARAISALQPTWAPSANMGVFPSRLRLAVTGTRHLRSGTGEVEGGRAARQQGRHNDRVIGSWLTIASGSGPEWAWLTSEWFAPVLWPARDL